MGTKIYEVMDKLMDNFVPKVLAEVLARILAKILVDIMAEDTVSFDISELTLTEVVLHVGQEKNREKEPHRRLRI